MMWGLMCCGVLAMGGIWVGEEEERVVGWVFPCMVAESSGLGFSVYGCGWLCRDESHLLNLNQGGRAQSEHFEGVHF